jgi:C-terminal processing protease CtpA/Prc
MKKAIINVTLIFFSSLCLAQLPLPPDSIYQIIKKNSVYRNNVDWSKLDQDFRHTLDTAKTLKDTMNSFIAIFREFDDPHSALYFNNNYYGYRRKSIDSLSKRLSPLREKSRAENGKVRTAFLEDKYVYIQIPSITAWGTQIDSFARVIDNGICSYPAKKVKGFIIDLRLNFGGNIYPMLAGLSSLLGNAYVGAERDIHGKINSRWEIKDGNFVQGGYRQTNIQSACRTGYAGFRVVLLLSPITISSGSMTAVAFKGRPNTYFIGEPTGNGYTTVNSWTPLRDNLVLNFATAFISDRNGIIYKTTVDPDLKMYEGNNFENLQEDDKIKVAVKWLRKRNSR